MQRHAPAGMALVETGTYEPLFKNEGAQPVPAFYLDVYPVTNGQYLEFVAENPAWRKSSIKKIFADKSYLKHWASDLDLGQDEQKRSMKLFCEEVIPAMA